MGSGLILLLIVGAWLAVLVPMALRSHDAASALGTVDRFSDAMRVLARRDSGARAPDPGPAPEAGPAPADTPAVTADRRTRSGPTPAARRRRALAVLVVVAVSTLAGGLTGPVWLLAPHLVADLLLVFFLGWLRTSAVARAEREWRAAMGDRRSSESSDEGWSPLREWSPEPRSVRVSVPAQSVAPVTVPEQDVFDQDALERDVPGQDPAAREVPVFDQEALDADAVDVGSRSSASGALRAVPAARTAPPARARGAQGEPWQPVPLPVPTYVTAARAPRRVVDLTAPRPDADQHPSAGLPLGHEDSGPELEHVLGRRAVGG